MLARYITRLPRAQGLFASSSLRMSPVTPLSIKYSTTTATENAPDHKGSDGGHDAHESHYDAPGGWLWGQRPGEKYEREGWEYPFYIGFVGSWIIAVIAYTMKEDTSIQTWALEEARRRLEKEGILEDTSK